MTDTLSTDHEIVVIGAGFSGIGFAIKAKAAGYTDLLIVDDADGVGGTWHWNTYPGVAVDIPSFSYQYSFAQRPTWSRTYAPGRELKQYAEHCVDKYGIRPHLRLSTSIVAAEYDETRNRWILTTGSGGSITARFVVNAAGVLTRPKLPDIAGLEDFAGIAMHTARWDHRIELRGKKVGIVGTGASAVQVIPEIAAEAKRLTVFQRTPIWCLPKLDVRLTKPATWALEHLPPVGSAARLASQAFVEVTFPIAAHYGRVLPAGRIGERIATAYLRAQVHDPDIREKLTPRYGLGCKRPSFHNRYLATFNRPNVHLETDPIDHVTADAIHTVTGTAHELDILILATGFKVMDSGNMPTYDLTGSDGRNLEKWWDEHRLQSYEGVSVPGFPNHFAIFGPYGYNGSSYFALIEAQTRHILRCLDHARHLGAERIEVTDAANTRYFTEMLTRRKNQIFWQPSCAHANSYYFDKHGDVPLRAASTLETAWRSRRFNLRDYDFGRASQSRSVRAAITD
ncbi:NAD(P)/FAD-dependent oxidoreductase [Nocardia uniformis]|uniref:NAD(P)/FAD-dependent oxidoreductase n=1 Tax=Nocardia uniformis TaxID=53432 RepID=A0A849C8C6_9NOCA|nr:NAD(P)/FAD-dependent oxidoreductase [Nocardia uniformis]NNH71119.1 NAD(P)/FAD-dependent oxidoreductase [Nocardia uniformis]